MYPLLLVVVLLDGSLENLWVGSNDLADLLSVLEQQERGHGTDTELLCYVWHVIDIELVESGVCELVGEPVVCFSMSLASKHRVSVWYSLDNLRGDDLARSAPGSEAVKDEEGTLLVEGSFPICLAHEVVYALLCFRHGEESVGDDGLVEFVESC